MQKGFPASPAGLCTYLLKCRLCLRSFSFVPPRHNCKCPCKDPHCCWCANLCSVPACEHRKFPSSSAVLVCWKHSSREPHSLSSLALLPLLSVPPHFLWNPWKTPSSGYWLDHRGFIPGIWVELPAGLEPQRGTKVPTVLVISAQGTYFHAEAVNLTRSPHTP